MKLLDERYYAQRAGHPYQGVIIKREISPDRHYVTVELDAMQRWRSVEEVADYLRWVAGQVLTLKGESRKEKE